MFSFPCPRIFHIDLIADIGRGIARLWSPLSPANKRAASRLLLCLLALAGPALHAGTQTNQNLTWLSPTNAVLRLGQAYPLAAIADSGLPVTFRVQDGPAVIAGGKVTATNGGTITLVAEQTGDATHVEKSLPMVFNRTGLVANWRGSWPGDSSIEPGASYSVEVVDNLAYVANGENGLQILDVSDPDRPVRLGVAPTSHPAYRVQVVGHLAYVADTGAGLQILDVSDPAAPVRLSDFFPSGTAESGAFGVQLVGQLAYLACRQGGLQIVDVSDPAKPKPVGSFGTTGWALHVEVRGHLAFVACGDYGMQIIDVSDPAKPVLVGGYPVSLQCLDVSPDGVILYAGTTYAGLHIVDVRNPASPRLLGRYEAPQIINLHVSGNLAALALGELGAQLVDVTDPVAPALAGQLSSGLHDTDAQVSGDRAYVTHFQYGLSVLSLDRGVPQSLTFRPPSQLLVTNAPTLLDLSATASSGLPVRFSLVAGPATVTDGRLAITNHGLVRVRAEQAGDALYARVLADRTIDAYGLSQGVEYTGPRQVILTNPTVTLSTTSSSGLPVTFRYLYGPGTLVGNKLTGTNEGEVAIQLEQAGDLTYAPYSQIENIQFTKSGQTLTWLSPSNAPLTLGRAYPLAVTASSGLPVTFRVQSGPALITDGSLVATNLGPITVVAEQGYDARLEKVFNLPDTTPVVSNFHDDSTIRYFNGVQVVGERAYCIGVSLGLPVFDVSQPTLPRSIGGFSSSSTTALALANQQAYVATDNGFLQIFNLNDLNGSAVFTTFTGFTGRSIRVAGNLVFIANFSGGLSIYDCGRPGTLAFVGNYDSRGAIDLQVDGHLVYLADFYSGLQILDMTDPKNPVRVGGLAVDGSPLGVQVVGGLAYVAADGAGLQVIDVSNPASPRRVGGFQTKHGARGVHVVGERAYLAEGELAESAGSGVEVLDLRNPAEPVLLTSYDLTYGSFSSIQSDGRYAYATAGKLGFFILDFEKPYLPNVRLSEILPPSSELFLNVEVLGEGPAQFQWFRNDQPLAGESNVVLRLAELTPLTVGDYSVQVSSLLHQGRSDPVKISLPAPRIDLQPADISVVLGVTNALTVTASAFYPFQYQWRHEGVPLDTQTNRNLLLPPLQAADLGGYDVVVSNPYGMVTSRVAQITLATNVPNIFFSLSLLKSLPDGRALLGGRLNGPNAPVMIVRLLPDLSVDDSFTPLRFATADTFADVATLPDGRIVVLGKFTRQNSSSVYLRCYAPNGREDSAFVSLEGPNPQVAGTPPTRLVADGSGHLLIPGVFSSGGLELRPLVQVMADGARDPLFAANLSLALATAKTTGSGRDLARQADGRLVLSGTFTGLAGARNRTGILRLNADGTADDTFVSGTGFNTGPSALAVDAAGRVLASGGFSSYNGKSVLKWVRLNADGSLDGSFSPTNLVGNVLQMQELRDGQLLVRTSEYRVQRFSPAGELLEDLGFSTTQFAVEPSGSILFGTVNPTRLLRLPAPVPVVAEVEMADAILSVSEAAAAVRLPLRRTGPAEVAAEVSYSIRAGTALAGVDVLETNGMVQFGVGVREAFLAIPLSAQNTNANDDRTILVQLDGATGAALSPARTNCVVTLRDDDVGLTAEVFASQPVGVAANPYVTEKAFFFRPLDRRRDDAVFFEWDSTGPAATTNDYFSTIWTGWIVPEVSGQYVIATWADDGLRAWLDDQPLLSAWSPSSATLTKSKAVTLEAGKPYRLVINYFEETGQAMCRLLWTLPGTTALTPIPRRVLRPGGPEFTPPSLTVNGMQITYSSEAGRPLSIQSRTNGTDWGFLREAVSASDGVTNSFTVKAKELTDGALLRAISVDGLAVTNALPPLLRVNGSTNGSEITLLAHQTNAVSLSVPVYEGVGQSIAWLRNGAPAAFGSPLVVSGLDTQAAGTYQAVVTYPFGQVTSNLRQISLVEPRPPRISTAVLPATGSWQIHIEADPSTPGQAVRLEVSTDLQHWERLSSGTGAFDFTLPPASGPAQFFRAVVE
jgi:uncharacterized delta-60 repeat protein